jgi:hypothetical protein
MSTEQTAQSAEPTNEKTQGRPVRRGLYQALLLAVIMFASLGFYLAVIKWRGPAADVVTKTRWDDWLPFSPAWVWVYLIPYLIGPLVAAWLRWETFTWFVRRGLVLVFISLAIFVVYPTKTERPPLADEASDGPLTAAAYNHMATIDQPPANAAPSLHVSLTCLLFWALVRDFPRVWPVSLAGVTVVWLATLLTWQHHLIDVATGVLLGSVLALPWPAWGAAHKQ